MEAIFDFKSKDGKLTALNPEGFRKYCLEVNDEIISGEYTIAAQLPEKIRMYRYLMGPLMYCAIEALTAAGYSGIDKVVAEYHMRAQFAKSSYMKPTGEEEVYLLEKKNMSKKRLHKYITDIIFYLETEFGQTVPDAEFYTNKLTGNTFQSVKKIKNDGSFEQ